MLSSSMRERSRSPIIVKDEYDDEQDEIGRYDKSHFDSKLSHHDRTQRSHSRDRSRGERSSSHTTSSSKIYIANLPFSYKWQDVKDLLKNKVGMVDFVETFEHDNRPRGCAVVEFRTRELAQLGLDTLNGCEVGGRKLRAYSKEEASSSRDFFFLFRNESNRRNILERIHSRESHTNTTRRTTFPRNEETYGLSFSFLESLRITEPLTNRLFVANIDFKVTDSDLEKVFGMAGPVKSVEISRDPDGKSKGFAIVEFEHPVHAVQGISMFHNQKYFDRELCVRMDRDSGQKFAQRQPSNLPPGLKSIGVGLGVNGNPVIDIATLVSNASGAMTGRGGNEYSSPESNLPMRNMNPNANFNNQMGMPGLENVNPMNNMGSGSGLPMNNSFGANPQSQGGFSNFGGQGQMGLNPMSTSQNPEFMSRGGQNMNMEGMARGIAGNNMNRFGFGDGRGVSGYGDAGGPGGFQRGSGNGIGGMQGGRGSMGGLRGDNGGGIGGGATSRFENRLGEGIHNSGDSSSRVEGRSGARGGFNESNVVHISNLPLDYTWQNLRDLCNDYGEVRFAEITGKGVGMVRFGSQSSASTAVDLLDRQRFDGKFLEARIF